MAATLLLGCHGWNHPDWVGSYYHNDSDELERLSRYAADFPTVEVPDTFAGVPPKSLVEGWRDAVPNTFRFALKVPQQITHERRFVDCGRLLCRFLDRLAPLEDRLGPLLLTVSAAIRPNPDTLLIVRNLIQALPAGFKWVLECRRTDWITKAFLDLLRSGNVALALTDDRWIRRRLMLDLACQPTAEFGYVRWSAPRSSGVASLDKHGSFVKTLAMWSPALAELRERVTCVFGYFSRHHGDDSFRSPAGVFRGLVDTSHPTRFRKDPLLPTSQLCIFCRNESSRCRCPDKTKES